MQAFDYTDGVLRCERVPLTEIAERFGTPTYVYSRNAIRSAYREFAQAAARWSERSAECTALVTYAVKANGNLAVLHDLAREGAGFDIVSAGELARVLAAGGRADRVVFSGVGKTEAEIRTALQAGVKGFNVESEAELERLARIAAELDTRARVSIRVNPDVDAGTHPYISTGLRQNKFGIAHERAVDVYRHAASLAHLDVIGIDCHIGSQITSLAPFLAALDKVLELVDAIGEAGVALHHLDLGGGLGIRYDDETPPERATLLEALFARIDAWRARRPIEVVFEFGRSIVAEAGALVTRVEHLKANGERHFAIVDAAMNDLLRPTLYDAHHPVQPVRLAAEASAMGARTEALYDVVGPVCESGDWLARGRALTLAEGDLLAVLCAGAYGFAMSSNYNARPRAAEVMVDGDRVELVRARERLEDLWKDERVLAD